MDPSLISDPKEQKWVAEISEILNRQLEIKVEIPPVSIFQIPETITTKKPEAYKPQHVGLGPYHHFQPGPYSKMQQKKLVLLQRLLQEHKVNDFRVAILDKVEKLVPVIRACYETFLQDDNVSMAWVFAIDGLFLLNLFKTNIHDKRHPKLDQRKRLLAQDIMMVENQIPFIVLKEINEALRSSNVEALYSLSDEEAVLASSDDEALYSSSDAIFSPSIFRSFSDTHSPLELCSRSQAPVSVEHLLHYMYYSIINNRPPTPSPSPPPVASSLPPSPSVNKLSHIRISATGGSLTHWMPSDGFNSVVKQFNNVSNFIDKAPKEEIVHLYEQTITSLQKFSSNKITIPSASKLKRIAGFSFHDLPRDEGIEKINIKGKNFSLPHLTLNNDSEVILRNLVAYETLMPNSDDHPLTEYMGLMCGLIVNVEDVKLLKKENIIKGDLGEGEVVKLFVEMSGSILSLKNKKKSKLQKVIDEVNEVYESRPMIKAYLLFKKPANWLRVGLTHIGSFVEATWKIVAFVISIVTVFMLTYQAYCDVYGCDKNNVVTLLPYASS